MVLILGWSCGSRLLSLKLVILPCVRSTSQRTSRCGDEDVNKLQPEIVADHSSPARLDGNNVDIDSEMMRLSKNTLLNNTYLQIISTKMAMMRRAVDGR